MSLCRFDVIVFLSFSFLVCHCKSKMCVISIIIIILMYKYIFFCFVNVIVTVILRNNWLKFIYEQRNEKFSFICHIRTCTATSDSLPAFSFWKIWFDSFVQFNHHFVSWLMCVCVRSMETPHEQYNFSVRLCVHHAFPVNNSLSVESREWWATKAKFFLRRSSRKS